MIYFFRVMNMPRQARKLSRTNIYHVMLRGINRQTIFEDNEDMNYFLSEVKRCKDISDFRLYAFCLMANHVHLLLETNQEPLDMIFRRLGSRYAGWYNRKYGRVGHLFQDRYRSENVETEQYFMTVLRYILQNPMKAGMEKQPGSYRWSSYLAYEKGIGLITDTQYAVNMAGERETLVQFLREANDDQVMDDSSPEMRLSDEQAQDIMKQISQCATIAEFQKLEDPLQKECIKRLSDEGISVRQISRITGKCRKTISRIISGTAPQRQDYITLSKEELADIENQAVLREAGLLERTIW